MNSDEVPPSLNARFKERFQVEPERARVTLRARGRVGKEGTCKLETGKPGIEAGLHPAVGGGGVAACAGEMLLEALVSCAGVTLGQVATAMEIDLRDAVVRAEGDVDFRGSLGLSEEVPVGVHNIRLHFDVDSDATEEQLATLVRITQRYCVVSRTLKPKTALTFSSSTGSQR